VPYNVYDPSEIYCHYSINVDSLNYPKQATSINGYTALESVHNQRGKSPPGFEINSAEEPLL